MCLPSCLVSISSTIRLRSATGLFNLEQLDWDAGALEYAGVTPKQLSDACTYHASP